MDANLSLFNQINSLCYWLLTESNYKSSVILDADKDSYFVRVKKGNQSLYAYQIPQFSKKNPRFLNFELTAVVNSLLLIKDTVMQRRYESA
ncbi:hypothetical protein ESY86_10845 [Subsaximicrobium wynnwilliamsii]|jgi:DNA mismatch repair ATPase MutS|uniref:Uncharacterized protein n=1 Tax=Subsaximicrobium wynnwilliamsii TaxID=291179 RepID=A0A5C6ZII0_9FLAO|nr:hypothetical protein [Subsaximicrobium wynnwilliamsii]TXD84062.1 hypothetical protein ESY87_05995 [Subsaximicrobium wynnwilliamsii]TXD88980.1 hypothetical protein ESY86_10845 [Subsaximicrobium wynnwilliamsii]TXE03774.1 hypothetical protein ESY88_05990 [Subsaximicrobium wynnwilliamsii]